MKKEKKNVDKLYVNHQAHMKLYQLHTVKKNKIEKFVTFSITLWTLSSQLKKRSSLNAIFISPQKEDIGLYMSQYGLTWIGWCLFDQRLLKIPVTWCFD